MCALLSISAKLVRYHSAVVHLKQLPRSCSGSAVPLDTYCANINISANSRLRRMKNMTNAKWRMFCLSQKQVRPHECMPIINAYPVSR